MAAPLNTCTAIEQRGAVRFLWTKDMAANNIHKETLPLTSNNPLKQHLSGEHSPDDDVIEEQCARGSGSNHKNFTPQVSRDL